MNFYINHIKINSIANLGSLNIGFNLLSDNKASEISVDESASTAGTPAGQEVPPPAPVVNE